MKTDTIQVGGQAVIEGVMMRTPGAVAVAVRKPSGEITVKSELVTPLSARPKILRIPIIRGVVNLFLSLRLGIHALNFSANESLEEENEKLDGWSLALTLLIALALGIGLFVYLPLLLTNLLKAVIPSVASSSLVFNLVDGVIRVIFFLAYVLSMTLIKDLRRVFEYHGAEHKTIYAYESGETLTSDQADQYSTLHPRCGTNFLMIVMLLSILVFSLLRSDASFAVKFLSRIVFIPLIAGISYEFIRFAAKNQDKAVVRWVSTPGLYLQRITTRPPSKDQIDVAIRALEEAIKLEKAHYATTPGGIEFIQ
jgi:uncharacterized protein YqhQ